MTHRATYTKNKTNTQQASAASLVDAIKAHYASEIASFHTPGHKGKAPFANTSTGWRMDVTELPGLDELAHPTGLLESLQQRFAQVYGSNAAFVSINGASAALMAAILSCAPRGKKILLPRNAHRSAINALVLTGLEPVWYEPDWQPDWQVYGAVELETFSRVLAKNASKLAAAVVVSPTYAGAVSDIEQIVQACHDKQIPLIVDEAHGSHFIPGSTMPPSAVTCGADLVVHSAHKTLGALTQTGCIHVGKQSLVQPEAVRSALNLLQSSSPSYLLLSSLEAAIEQAKSQTVDAVHEARAAFDRAAAESLPDVRIYAVNGSATEVDPLHLLLTADGYTADELFDWCCALGVYPEAIIGKGVLFLLGVSTSRADLNALLNVLKSGTNGVVAGSISPKAGLTETEGEAAIATDELQRDQKADACVAARLLGEQVLSPREAFFAASEVVAVADCVGRIAAECIAPCPPGTPVTVPGARITSDAQSFIPMAQIRVVVESGSRRT